MTAPTPPAPTTPNRLRSWALLGTGCIVILTGFLAPCLLPRQASSSSSAQDRAPKTAPLTIGPDRALPTPADDTALFIRLGVSTAVVLTLLLGTLLVLKRWLVPATAGLGGDIRLLGATRLDGRSLVYLVQARGHRLLVGADVAGVKQVVLVPSRRAVEG